MDFQKNEIENFFIRSNKKICFIHESLGSSSKPVNCAMAAQPWGSTTVGGEGTNEAHAILHVPLRWTQGGSQHCCRRWTDWLYQRVFSWAIYSICSIAIVYYRVWNKNLIYSNLHLHLEYRTSKMFQILTEQVCTIVVVILFWV